MIVIGILLLLGGALFITCGLVLPYAQLTPEQAQKFHQLQTQLPASVTAVFLTVGSAIVLAGLYHIVGGFLVRLGKRAAIYAALATSMLAVGFCALYILGGIVLGGADAIVGICFLVLIGALFVWLITWLFRALQRAGSNAAAAPQSLGFMAPPPPPSPEPTGWAYGAQAPPPPPPTGVR